MRKNLNMNSSETESQKYFHNHVTKPFYMPPKIVEDEEGNLLMITNGEEETVKGLVEEAKNGEGSPREIIVGPGQSSKTLKSTVSTNILHKQGGKTMDSLALTIYKGPVFQMTEVFTEADYLASKRKGFQKELIGAVYGVK
jgi:hypothetical protein